MTIAAMTMSGATAQTHRVVFPQLPLRYTPIALGERDQCLAAGRARCDAAADTCRKNGGRNCDANYYTCLRGFDNNCQ